MANPQNPIVVFSLNLNSDVFSFLHPARSQSDQDLAIEQIAQFEKLKTSYLPGLLSGENVEHQSDGTFTFTLYGRKAQYLVDNFTSGDNAYFTVVSRTYGSA